MCQLQTTIYACGHQRKTLLQACAFAQKLTSHQTTRAPSFCINGLDTIQSGLSRDLCGLRAPEGDSCAENKDLMSLYSRQADLYEEFSAYAQRIQAVATALHGARDRLELICNWHRVAQDRHDAEALRSEYQVLWRETVPAYCERVQALYRQTARNLEATAAQTVERVFGRAYMAPSGCADADGLDESPALRLYERSVDALRGHMQREIHQLERYAVIACLDGVGWRLPGSREDEELLVLARGRVVKPWDGGVETWGERWLEIGTAGGKVELIDRLDLAE